MRFSLLPKFYYSSSALPIHRIRFNNMSTEIPKSKSPITAEKSVEGIQQVFSSSSTNRWDKYWEENLTPWDLGRPTPVLMHLHDTGVPSHGQNSYSWLR